MPSDVSWQRARETVVLYGRRLQAEGLVHWTSGNLSLRVAGEADLIAMTPTDVPYDTMQPEDVCIVRSDGSIVDGRRAPTSEFPLHTLVYQRRAEVGAVSTVRYSRPGTPEMADFTAEAVSDRGACFLRHHGLLAIGATIERAFKAAAVTEASADVYLRARQFGDVPELPAAEVTWIADLWRRQWAADA